MEVGVKTHGGDTGACISIIRSSADHKLPEWRQERLVGKLDMPALKHRYPHTHTPKEYFKCVSVLFVKIQSF